VVLLLLMSSPLRFLCIFLLNVLFLRDLRGLRVRHLGVNDEPAVRKVAGEFGFPPFQDEEIQGSWVLTFGVFPDDSHTGEAVVALLRRGCGVADNADITYAAGALDAA